MRVTICKPVTHQIILGGDLLSQARAGTAIKIRSNSETPSTRLEDLVLTI